MLRVGVDGKVYKTFVCQAGTSFNTKDCGTQYTSGTGSYQRKTSATLHWTYDELKDTVLCNREALIRWLMDEEVIASRRACPVCGENMGLVECTYRSDGYKWECKKRATNKRHKSTVSIWKGSWFEQSNLTLEEIIKFTYWWSEGLTQEQIKKQLHIYPKAAVDWDMFCRETCEVTIQRNSEKFGGEGKVVRIDESKVGKQKYHRGHRVEGQWVFGGIEEDSRRCFLVSSLLPIIKDWIEPGTLIVSDCWKSYHNLDKHGYSHQTMNHSKEFVNEDGYNTNKMEGHWGHMKVSLPVFGTRKDKYSSYLACGVYLAACKQRQRLIRNILK
ncbi:uncharacterized protein [Montipora capricornis]|uniref:uncharacterized protein n=1 Tax=Montipora capricornis TaxID=246305 RepID=UPI0035F1EB25